MNKKVLSAILFSALFAGTGTFTSCIDNDEPAGIEELRGAKAELIRAKVAVEAANAAFRLAQAEHEKAEAAIDLAEAKIKEATAKLEEAKAERQEIENEAARVELDNKIANLEMQMEEAVLAHEKNMLIKQQALAEAKRSYDIALKQIAIAEALMSESQKVAVSTLKSQVNTLMGQIAMVEDAIEAKNEELYHASMYLGAETEYQVAYAEQKLAAEEAALEANAEAIAKYKKYMEVDSTAAESDWRAEIAEIEAEVAEYDKQIAVLKLEATKKQESEECKALAAAVEAAKAAKAELKAPKTAEELAYTYIYWAAEQDKKIVAAEKDTDAETAAKKIAGDDFMKAEEYGAGIAALKNEIASYTTEKQYWLDSIAAQDGKTVADNDKKAADAVTAWTNALAAYKNAKVINTNAMHAVAADGTQSGAWVDYVTATNKAGVTAEDILIAKQALADAIVAYYNTLPANQVTLRTVTLSSSVDGETVYASKTVKEWLSDASMKHRNLDKLIFGYNGVPAYFDHVSALWEVGATAEVKNTNGSVKTATTGAFASWVVKSNSTETYDVVIGGATPTTLYGKLVKASKDAFGLATLYSDKVASGSERDYLRNKPTLEDVKYVYSVTNDHNSVGVYGKNLLGKDDNIDFIANNYKAIIADYEAAIEYWTAAVDEIKEAVTEYNAAVKAADKAITDAEKAEQKYITAITTEYNKAVAALDAKVGSLNAVKSALINAVDVYLAENYSGEVNFMDWLAAQVKTYEANVINLEYAVAKAEADLKAAEEGHFLTADNVATVQKDLDNLEEKLAGLVADLEAAIEALATAEEVWAE